MRKRGQEVKGKKKKDAPHCRIYIFCEGTTENIYLQHLKSRKNNLDIIFVDSDHTDAKGIVSYAKKYIQKEKLNLKLGDRGFCVFDDDPKSNTNIKEVFNMLNGCKKMGLDFIYSNPCFEVWFVLHFRDAPHGNDATQMKRLVKKLLDDSTYSETTDIYQILLPLRDQALKRARQLDRKQREVYDSVCSHECNPYTNIYEFFDYMEILKENT